MRNNKILTAAIASALSLGAGTVLAANVEIVFPGADYTTFPFATQLFPSGTIANDIASPVTPVCGSGDHYLIKYKIPFAGGLLANDIVKVKATLSNSATWGYDVNPTNQVRFCSSSALVGGVCDAADPDTHPVTITKSSTVTDKTLGVVEFALQVTAAIASAPTSSFLFFCPSAEAPFLQTADSTLSLTMATTVERTVAGSLSTITVGSAETIPIATSKAGLSVKIDAATTPTQAAISFSSDALKFATGSTKNNMTDIDRVNLGTVWIEALGTAKDRDGVTGYSETFSGWSGKLTIIDGPFSASTGANQVFLNQKDDCVFDSATSISASTVTNTTAEWTTLTTANLASLTTAPGLYVCVIADGVKTIEEQSKAPTATLSMGKGTLTAYQPGRLRHLKENGTKCTLFNVPDGTETLAPTLSTDVVSIRITNNGPDEGSLYATLYDQSGKTIYTPKRQKIGTIGPYATVRYYTGEESATNYDPAFDLTTYGTAQHWVGQRAMAIIATELPDVSIFNLVRHRNAAPNINMSTGATGNGCD